MEAAGIALRLLDYIQSALLLGLLLFAMPWSRQVGRLATVLALTGAALAFGQLVLLAGAFADGGPWVNSAMIGMLLTDTAMGWTTAARIEALTGVAIAISANAPRPWVSAIAMIAIVTLSWNGHGNMTEGAIGWVHLTAIGMHLLAGVVWAGAVAVFLWTAFQRDIDVPNYSARLQRFAATGSALVAILIATGFANALFIVGWQALPAIVERPFFEPARAIQK